MNSVLFLSAIIRPYHFITPNDFLNVSGLYRIHIMKKQIISNLSASMAEHNTARLEGLLDTWKDPDPETVLTLLDTCGNNASGSACLLEYLHRTFSPEIIQSAREKRLRKTLGFADPDEDDWSEQFSWETVPEGCRILSYMGTDEEVLIPERIGETPVKEISQLFFLSCTSVHSLLLPEGIQADTLKPSEARHLFGKELCNPEIIQIPSETGRKTTPDPEPAPPLCDPAACFTIFELPEGSMPDTLQFGRWVCEDGHSESPLLWTIIRQRDDRILLLLKTVPERLPYHSCRTGVLWDSCDLRKWLNTAFYTAAFTKAERDRICPVSIKGKPNPAFGTRNQSVSEDHVFLLSPEEWNALPEGTVEHHGCLWLRMPGLTAQYAVTADSTGRISLQGELVNTPEIGFLPAIWVQI